MTPIPQARRCCNSEHEPPDTACQDFLAGQNGRCVYCDHEDKCHPGPGATCWIGRTAPQKHDGSHEWRKARFAELPREATDGMHLCTPMREIETANDYNYRRMEAILLALKRARGYVTDRDVARAIDLVMESVGRT